ncbi:eukaryotic translation initiation factor 2 subunit alpha homolog, partial [Malus sylvestris]|uniref:eukaryotic translation initiation factor 2 subunit alpha homolog n=1 Tax=Malus sylvestris TaxID=3752 RepID=UPI0021AC7DB4
IYRPAVTIASQTPNLECRMYEARYPEVDMAVMIQVKNIVDMGAYVSLLECNIKGMILFSELSHHRIRSVSSLIKVDRIEPVMVLRVDKEKGYIDMSKQRVSEEDIQTCEERYNKSKLVHSIMCHVGETLEIDLEDLHVNIGWPLYQKYGHAYDLGELDQALFLYLDGQSQDHHNPLVNHVHHQDQRHPHQNNSSSGMRPLTLNIYPPQRCKRNRNRVSSRARV